VLVSLLTLVALSKRQTALRGTTKVDRWGPTAQVVRALLLQLVVGLLSTDSITTPSCPPCRFHWTSDRRKQRPGRENTTWREGSEGGDYSTAECSCVLVQIAFRDGMSCSSAAAASRLASICWFLVPAACAYSRPPNSTGESYAFQSSFPRTLSGLTGVCNCMQRPVSCPGGQKEETRIVGGRMVVEASNCPQAPRLKALNTTGPSARG
jgi:hypothetical protein